MIKTIHIGNHKKAAIAALKEQGYVTLTLTQQVSFFSQTAIEIFQRLVDNLINGAIQTVNEINASEKTMTAGAQ